MPSRQGNPEKSSGAPAIPQSPIGFSDDHFPSQSPRCTVSAPVTEAETATVHAGNTPHRGVPSLESSLAHALTVHSRSEKLQGGQPPRYTVPVHLFRLQRRPPACHRRGRSPSIISLATTPMVRRWSAGCNPAAQKAGSPRSQDRCGFADVEIHPSLSARVCRVTVRVLKGLAAGHECPAYSSE